MLDEVPGLYVCQVKVSLQLQSQSQAAFASQELSYEAPAGQSMATCCPPCHPALPNMRTFLVPCCATGPIWRPPAPNQVVRSLDVFSGAPADLTDMLLVHARLTGGQAGGRGAAGRDCALPCVERLFGVALLACFGRGMLRAALHAPALTSYAQLLALLPTAAEYRPDHLIWSSDDAHQGGFFLVRLSCDSIEPSGKRACLFNIPSIGAASSW